jgi:hypothetical protein
MALIFQYGSNCLESQINSESRLRGAARFISIAETVDDYELTFDVWSVRRGCAAADMRPKHGSTVWGVLYEVDDCLLDRDTALEGRNYQRHTIRVRRLDGDVAEAQSTPSKNHGMTFRPGSTTSNTSSRDYENMASPRTTSAGSRSSPPPTTERLPVISKPCNSAPWLS